MSSYTLLSTADLLQSTYKPIVRIEVKRSNGQSSWGSGVLVGANDVLTAAHLFETSNNAAIIDVVVYPGYYYGPSSVIAHAAQWASVAPPSTSGTISVSDVRGDLALVSLNQALGLARGYWAVGADFTNGTALTAGYPGTLNGAPAVSSGWVGTLSVFQSNALDIGNLYAQPGSSGSPIFVLNAQQQPTVVGVLSTGTWAVNVTATRAGQSDLSWIQDHISQNNLDVAGGLPRISMSSALAKVGPGVTLLNLHFPVTLSYALAVDTHLNAQLLDATGRSDGTADVVIAAGTVQALLDLPVPLSAITAGVAREWTLSLSGADNALFATSGSAAALMQQATIRIEGGVAAGSVGGSDLPESVVLSAGNDVYQGLGGDDDLTGGDGIDTAIYRGPRKDYQIQKLSADSWQLRPLATGSATAKSDGVDTLHQFERLQFSDVSLALDLNGQAGGVAKVLGAVLGKASLQNKAIVGYALAVLDQGGGYQGLISQALPYVLGAGFSHEAEIQLLYKNLLQRSPTADELNDWSSKMATGELSDASLVLEASESTINAVNINLLGLMQTGLEYTV